MHLFQIILKLPSNFIDTFTVLLAAVQPQPAPSTFKMHVLHSCPEVTHPLSNILLSLSKSKYKTEIAGRIPNILIYL